MIAFVLSGAGNRGPLEVGALRALVEADIQPDFVVGTSAGAINASYIAARGVSTAVVNEMSSLWLSADKQTVYPGNIANIAWRVLTKQNSLYESHGMKELIEHSLPPGVRTYAELALPLYVTAVDLISSRLMIFGADDRENTPLVDTVLASASAPPIHPPVEYYGTQLVDGGVVANVPAEIAMERGATEIYLINATYGGGKRKPVEGIVSVLGRTLNTMLAQSLFDDLDRADADPRIDLHHIHLDAFGDISFRDFSQTDAMIDAGYRIAKQYLTLPRPRAPLPPASPAPAERFEAGEVIVPGGREYVLRRRR